MGVGSGYPGHQTGDAIIRFEKEFMSSDPECILVEGDTNTVLAGAIAASKLGIRIGHVEAGLRSYDLRMPEEINRRLTDHASDYLFAPTKESADILKKESAWGKIYRTGNTVIDATIRYLPVALKKSKIMEKVPWDEYALATLHRAENVDDPKTLGELVKILDGSPLPMVLPLHPRTDLRLRENGLRVAVESSKNIRIIPPAGYFDLLALMKNASFILTDSGGIQEEATSPVLKKRVFVSRLSTERPEAVRAGYCTVVGTDSRAVLRALRAHVKTPKSKFAPCPYGEGDASERIVSALKKELRA
jgi:UDP-N-acetylglucosamine 2-epimerase (non-hydrolysing)